MPRWSFISVSQRILRKILCGTGLILSSQGKVLTEIYTAAKPDSVACWDGNVFLREERHRVRRKKT